jgi:hypothetical protein
MRLLFILAVVVVFAAMLIFDTAALVRLTVICATGGCGVRPVWIVVVVGGLVLAGVLLSRQPAAKVPVVKVRVAKAHLVKAPLVKAKVTRAKKTTSRKASPAKPRTPAKPKRAK